MYKRQKTKNIEVGFILELHFFVKKKYGLLNKKVLPIAIIKYTAIKKLQTAD